MPSPSVWSRTKFRSSSFGIYHPRKLIKLIQLSQLMLRDLCFFWCKKPSKSEIFRHLKLWYYHVIVGILEVKHMWSRAQKIRVLSAKSLELWWFQEKLPPSHQMFSTSYCTNRNERWGSQKLNFWNKVLNQIPELGGGFKYSLFSPLLGEDSQFFLFFFKGVGSTTN